MLAPGWVFGRANVQAFRHHLLFGKGKQTSPSGETSFFWPRVLGGDSESGRAERGLRIQLEGLFHSPLTRVLL